MFEVNWTHDKGWGRPLICPIHNLSLHPSAKVFHYAQELFEGLKAFRGVDGNIRIFRPDMNMKRMRASAERINLPDFDGNELLECLKKLIQIDADWVPPYGSGASLYIRPTYIGTEPALGVHSSKDAMLYIICGPVGPYFPTGAMKPVSLLADPRFVRAWPGGVGDKKLGVNYGPQLAVQQLAEKMGHQQVLWLFGDDHQLTEVGAMNVFVYLVNDRGERELVTPPLQSGLILPGVTRLSLIQLAQQWSEFKITERAINMQEIRQLVKEKRLLEMFGAGTACSVCPIGRIHYKNEDIIVPGLPEQESLQLRLYKTLQDIQYGIVPHDWSVII
ncbi:branched-chain-amino-acid aminotransferase-like [Oppia nitens]|uniref:branched-chain-amino-acid aminotransferase-like n=1 Tax=Oppia nitens TaxID=1686743 RepID=UPI0023DA6896|nr:branched-chain-amino-acid aminotransferase-like [Oppia nitens]